MTHCVGVIGLGNWGTALAYHLSRKGVSTIGWSENSEIVEGFSRSNANPRYQQNAVAPKGLRVTGRISDLSQCEALVFAVPSDALSLVAPKLKDILPGKLLISGIKGFTKETLLTPLQHFEMEFSPTLKPVVLSGPCFAKDLVEGKPAGLVSASTEEASANRAAQLFLGGKLKVYVSGDPIGVELGGALKNVVALAVGICDGLSLGDSARAGLITRGLAEMTRLAVKMGAQSQTLAGLSGLGDLAMTATVDTSRNRTVGLRLGRGEKLEEILASLGSVAEGVSTTPLALTLAKRHKIELPIADAVEKVLQGKWEPARAVEELLNRPMRKEF